MSSGPGRARAISAAETRALRQKVLRPHQRLEELVYPGDEADDSLHVGLHLDQDLVGVGSISREPLPDPETATRDGWRIRGMAVLPEQHRRGLGRELLETLLAHARSKGGAYAWCNARSSAVRFYAALGFEALTEEFEIPDLGPHVRMRLRLTG